MIPLYFCTLYGNVRVHAFQTRPPDFNELSPSTLPYQTACHCHTILLAPVGTRDRSRFWSTCFYSQQKKSKELAHTASCEHPLAARSRKPDHRAQTKHETKESGASSSKQQQAAAQQTASFFVRWYPTKSGRRCTAVQPGGVTAYYIHRSRMCACQKSYGTRRRNSIISTAAQLPTTQRTCCSITCN